LATHKTPEHLLEKLRKNYAANPEPFIRKAREARRTHRQAINRRRRNLASEKRARQAQERWATYLQNTPSEALPWSEQLRLWFEAQPQLRNVRELARAVSVSPRSVFDWLRGKHPPVGRKRRKLYEISRLACFRVVTRERRPPRAAQQEVPLIIRDLVVRCGLAPREIQMIRTANVELGGIRLSGGRLIPFGRKWEYVHQQPIETWISLAKPGEFLFFRQKPVNRDRPADRLWIVRQLHAANVKVRKSQAGRVHHFAGDFLRMDTKDFLRHLQRKHGLSPSGAHSVRKELLKQRGLAVAANRRVEGIDPEAAYAVLYPIRNPRGAGRKATKTGIYAEAKRLHKAEGLSWPKIAKRLTPAEYAADPRKASEALRKGASRR